MDNKANTATVNEPLYQHPRYQKVKDLNAGAFGFVQLALDSVTNEEVAIKFIERGNSITKSVLREILNHRLCAVHPHIVQLREVFLTKQHLAIVMEYVAGGDLCDYFLKNSPFLVGKGLPENVARWFFQQLITALDFCHRKGIANRDIKLENTLLDGSAPVPLLKMCDFGYSKNEYIDSRPKTLSGTADYIAPEVLMHTVYDGKVADIWSCGVMLYILVAGSFPFYRPGDEQSNNVVRLQQIFPRILNADFRMPEQVTEPCKEILRRMLTADPDKRIQIHEIMEHPWFQTNLPTSMKNINDTLVGQPLPSWVQCVEEIVSIIEAATTV